MHWHVLQPLLLAGREKRGGTEGYYVKINIKTKKSTYSKFQQKFGCSSHLKEGKKLVFECLNINMISLSNLSKLSDCLFSICLVSSLLHLLLLVQYISPPNCLRHCNPRSLDPANLLGSISSACSVRCTTDLRVQESKRKDEVDVQLEKKVILHEEKKKKRNGNELN